MALECIDKRLRFAQLPAFNFLNATIQHKTFSSIFFIENIREQIPGCESCYRGQNQDFNNQRGNRDNSSRSGQSNQGQNQNISSGTEQLGTERSGNSDIGNNPNRGNRGGNR